MRISVELVDCGEEGFLWSADYIDVYPFLHTLVIDKSNPKKGYVLGFGNIQEQDRNIILLKSHLLSYVEKSIKDQYKDTQWGFGHDFYSNFPKIIEIDSDIKNMIFNNLQILVEHNKSNKHVLYDIMKWICYKTSINTNDLITKCSLLNLQKCFNLITKDNLND